jgi:hypothetical protein
MEGPLFIFAKSVSIDYNAFVVLEAIFFPLRCNFEQNQNNGKTSGLV